MAAYIIASYDIVNADRYAGYMPAVVPLLEKHGAEILAADYDARSFEGEKRSVYVIVNFESEERAAAWYTDPDYEPAKKIRLESCANVNLVLAQQFVPPDN